MTDRSPTRKSQPSVKWVDAERPLGNPADMPRPRAFADAEAWRLASRISIVTLPKDLIVKAKAPDHGRTFLWTPA